MTSADIRKAMYKSVELELIPDEDNKLLLGTFDSNGIYNISLTNNGYFLDFTLDNSKEPININTNSVIYKNIILTISDGKMVVEIKVDSKDVFKMHTTIVYGYIEFNTENVKVDRNLIRYTYPVNIGIQIITAPTKENVGEGFSVDDQVLSNNYIVPKEYLYEKLRKGTNIGIIISSYAGNDSPSRTCTYLSASEIGICAPYFEDETALYRAIIYSNTKPQKNTNILPEGISNSTYRFYFLGYNITAEELNEVGGDETVIHNLKKQALTDFMRENTPLDLNTVRDFLNASDEVSVWSDSSAFKEVIDGSNTYLYISGVGDVDGRFILPDSLVNKFSNYKYCITVLVPLTQLNGSTIAAITGIEDSIIIDQYSLSDITDVVDIYKLNKSIDAENNGYDTIYVYGTDTAPEIVNEISSFSKSFTLKKDSDNFSMLTPYNVNINGTDISKNSIKLKLDRSSISFYTNEVLKSEMNDNSLVFTGNQQSLNIYSKPVANNNVWSDGIFYTDNDTSHMATNYFVIDSTGKANPKLLLHAKNSILLNVGSDNIYSPSIATINPSSINIYKDLVFCNGTNTVGSITSKRSLIEILSNSNLNLNAANISLDSSNILTLKSKALVLNVPNINLPPVTGVLNIYKESDSDSHLIGINLRDYSVQSTTKDYFSIFTDNRENGKIYLGRIDAANTYLASLDATKTLNIDNMPVNIGSYKTTTSNMLNVYGKIKASQTTIDALSDYAEYFEWEDENLDDEDRVGYFVSFADDTKIVKATSESPILGIVSSTAAIIGRAADLEWHGKYIRDDWGRVIYDIIDIPESVDEYGKIIPASTKKIPRVNPKYDPQLKYVPRSERKEWATVGLIGMIYTRDDGTCIPGGYCKSNNNGIATKAESGYLVAKRVTKNIIEVLLK